MLASNYQDAERIARKRQLKPSWKFIADGSELRGTKHPVVFMAWDWSAHKTITEWNWIRQYLTLTQANIIRVERDT
ncbi:hypothetical protein [Catellatospora sichuanensis]|uniref:hypothetical protein n=1 Tax=Catellatospora sichuanensis TaxID=1969805 RepID=UPI00118384A4|nr:hypothetical protein [Catellatospora sichuanensis]